MYSLSFTMYSMVYVWMCAKSTKQDTCLEYYCNAYIYVRYIPIFHVISDVCSCLLSGFCRAHHPNQPANLMKLPHDSAAAPFDETDIELLDGKVMMEQFKFMPSVASSRPGARKLSIGVCHSCL
jgi:hypothetical protein